MEQKNTPSISAIQTVLGPVGVVTAKVGEETTYTYVGGNIEDYVPKVRDVISTVDYGNDHLVTKVVSVWTENSKDLVTFAITNRVSGKNIFVNGCSVQTLAATDSLAIQLQTAQLGTAVTDNRTGNILWVANVGGSGILDYEECKARQQKQRREERQMKYAGRVVERGRRLAGDKWQLGQFPELEAYRDKLEQELQAQIYFDEQELRNIDRLEPELQEAIEREATNLAPMRREAQNLQSEQMRQFHARLKQREDERLAELAKLQEERTKLRQLPEPEKLTNSQLLERQERQSRLEQDRKRQQPTAASGGCILTAVAMIIGAVLIIKLSVFLLQMIAFSLNM